MKDIKFLKFLQSNKGLSLIEMIAAVAILTTVIGPFLSSFLESTKNNVFSEDKISSSMLAQKTMEEMKSNSTFLSTNADLGVYTAYADSSAEFDVNYKITKVTSTLTVDSDYVVDPTTITFPLIFEVSKVSGDDTLKINNQVLQTYNFTDNPIYNTCKLYFDNVLEKLNVKDYPALSTTLSSDSATFSPADPLYIKVIYLSGADGAFTLNVDFDGIDLLNVSDRPEDIIFYVVDDTNSHFTLNNIGTKQFRTINKLTTDTENYSNLLYKIEVVVEKNGQELNKLISYIKK